MTTKLFSLTDKVAIVTGAGRGLGKILAQGLSTSTSKDALTVVSLQLFK
ncbi:MAG: hypothetical protein PUP93_26135 [Rhizonema sp. NSF051]|nr:hypothetical protein [Rhizonema sp. NSF051]